LKKPPFLFLPNIKLLDLTADAVTNENDNSPVYIKNLNNSSILTLNIKTLISQTANTRSYFTGDLLNWYNPFKLVKN
jgi:fumarate reductase subunit C